MSQTVMSDLTPASTGLPVTCTVVLLDPMERGDGHHYQEDCRVSVVCSCPDRAVEDLPGDWCGEVVGESEHPQHIAPGRIIHSMLRL